MSRDKSELRPQRADNGEIESLLREVILGNVRGISAVIGLSRLRSTR